MTPTPAEVAQMREALVLVDACLRVRELQAALRVAIWDRDGLWAGYAARWARLDSDLRPLAGPAADPAPHEHRNGTPNVGDQFSVLEVPTRLDGK